LEELEISRCCLNLALLTKSLEEILACGRKPQLGISWHLLLLFYVARVTLPTISAENEIKATFEESTFCLFA